MLVEALKVAAPMFLYIAGTMITFSCRNAFSLEAAPNGPSTLNYAWTWYQLPYGVIAVSLSTTLFLQGIHHGMDAGLGDAERVCHADTADLIARTAQTAQREKIGMALEGLFVQVCVRLSF